MLTLKEPNADVYLWLKQYPGEWLPISDGTVKRLCDDRGSIQSQHRYTQMHPPEFMTYDRSVDEVNYNAMLGMVLRELVPFGSRNEMATALEMGCSVDVSMHRFISPQFFGRYIGMDLHPESVYEGRHASRLELLCGSFHQIPFKDGSIDLLIEANAYDMTRCLDEALGEAYRVLRPGSVFIAFQDVIPNAIATIGCARDGELQRAYFRDGVQKDAHGLRNPVLVFAGGEMVDARSYHIAKVREAAVRVGFDIMEEGILEASELTLAKGRIPQRYTFVDHRCAKYVYFPDMKIPLGKRSVLTQANILVMRRPLDA